MSTQSPKAQKFYLASFLEIVKIKAMIKNKKDVVLLITFFIFSITLLLYGYYYKEKNKLAGKVVIETPALKKIVSLNKNQEIDIKTHIVIIKNRKVRVIHAKCPLKICEKTGWVSDGLIVCVPNRVIIKVFSNKKNKKKTDVIAR